MERLIPMNVEQIRRQGMKNAELQRKREKEFDEGSINRNGGNIKGNKGIIMEDEGK